MTAEDYQIRNVQLRPSRPEKGKRWPQLIYHLVGTRHTPVVTLHCSDAEARREWMRKLDAIKTEPWASQHIPKFGGYRQTYLEAAERYLLHLRSLIESPHPKGSEHTYRIVNASLKKFFESLGDIPVAEVSPYHVDEFIRRLETTETRNGGPHSINSINTYVRHLSTAFTWLQQQGQVKKNPFAGKQLKKPRGKREKPRYFTDGQLTEIEARMRTAGLPWHRFAFYFALGTGCRVGGVLDANVNRMWHQNQKGEIHWFMEVTEKGRSGGKTRDVPLPDWLVGMIRDRQAVMGDHEALYRQLHEVFSHRQLAPYLQRAEEGYLIFEVQAGNTDSVSRMFARHLRTLKLPGSMHWLRHTFARLYLENGGDIATLAEILGHESVSTTYDFYGHITRVAKGRSINERTFKPSAAPAAQIIRMPQGRN